MGSTNHPGAGSARDRVRGVAVDAPGAVPGGNGRGEPGGVGVPRRRLARGAMWAVPTIALSTLAPAYAASTDTYAPTVCDLYYPTGSSSNFQGLEMSLGVQSTSATIPRGTTFRWAVGMSGYGTGSHDVPTTNYSANARWNLELSPPPDTPAMGFTVTLTVLGNDVTAGELNCQTKLVWNDTYAVVGGTRIDITGTASVTDPSQGQTQSSGLSFSVARRYPTSLNQPGRLSHKYLSKSGGQSCYPLIRYVYGGASAIEACGDGHNSTSTIYPGPADNPTATTCVRLKTANGTVTGQGEMPARC